ncbi:ABC transporter ATP-binding protein [Crocosphaera sp. UHCC 0190]|uniref:ABC transporter ATP-binding protein n=1 Tax=Crocosphaera sp. UHCC 0190 TaxID=3110246 RepID=UPI002B20D1C6|nr:ABC transporter ATP-binding protein [Crocosphaera sp. UHCC 0190]MEA5509374.1 ABC transporter ATP-binding protein [Crocosphaera sp. UHCC 0190]
MTDEVLVKVENVSKKFCRDLKQSLWYGVQDIGSEVVGRKYEHQLREGEFWSVNDISFELRRGECLGLIGPNGAGKSTLLKILNGLFKPDKGRIEMRGRICSLIELSAGFNAILTGRENIYSRGSVLGFTKAEIDKKLDDIIQFSELEDFIDTPVVNYSSGMKVRLGFAVAAQMEPDVLLLDEVLAVGDVGFRAKCFNTIYKMMQNAAVILVSHSMPQISRVCSDILVMDHGQCVFQGKDVPRGIDQFYSYFQGEEEGIITGSEQAVIHGIEFGSKGEKPINSLNYLDDFSVYIDLSIAPEIHYPSLAIDILNQELQMVAQCYSYHNGFVLSDSGERTKVEVNFDKLILNPGTYSITLTVMSDSTVTKGVGAVLCKHYNCKKFTVKGDFFCFAPVHFDADWKVI